MKKLTRADHAHRENPSEMCPGASAVESCCTPSAGRPPLPDMPVRPDQTERSNPWQAASQIEVSLPGGRFLMGTDYPNGFSADGEGPVRPVVLSPFSIDAAPVTTEEFAAFIEATGYRTDAERFGWSFVFWLQVPEDRFEELVADAAAQTPCATRRTPEGPGSDVRGRPHHPVVHVSWNDASAYAEWAGKSLPTEAQWEYAARGGLEQKLYPWGDELIPGGLHRCNIWQGEFPLRDTGEDGYAGTCPVDAFPPNGFGLYSCTGNVWEWCVDWFGTAFASGSELQNPSGPQSGTARVMKGGSFLCHASYCNRYRVAARTSNTPDSSASNIGFRCARG